MKIFFIVDLSALDHWLFNVRLAGDGIEKSGGVLTDVEHRTIVQEAQM